MEPYLQLEQSFGEWAGVRNVVACSSGTAALHLALEALDLPRPSRVAVPDFCMVAVARAVRLAGHEPVFVDVGEDCLLDVDMVPDVECTVLVHTYGRRCRYVHRGFVVEDLAEAHGIRPWHSSDAACWSFYRNKVIAGEEGGAVSFASHAAASRARQLRCLGFTEAHDFEHVPRGHNYRLANCLAELVLRSMDRYAANLASRLAAENLYDELIPERWRMPARRVPWVYDVRLRGMSRDQQNDLVAKLKANGVAARHGFKPLRLQAEFLGCESVVRGTSDILAREVIYLPMEGAAKAAELLRLFAPAGL